MIASRWPAVTTSGAIPELNVLPSLKIPRRKTPTRTATSSQERSAARGEASRDVFVQEFLYNRGDNIPDWTSSSETASHSYSSEAHITRGEKERIFFHSLNTFPMLSDHGGESLSRPPYIAFRCCRSVVVGHPLQAESSSHNLESISVTLEPDRKHSE